jgi:hypothetical protein
MRRGRGHASPPCSASDGRWSGDTGRPTARRGSKGTEHRCGSCRSEIAFDFPTSSGPFLSIAVGLLDDPDACPPRFHQWFSERLRWLHVHDTLPKYADDRIPHPDARRQAAGVVGRPRKG